MFSEMLQQIRGSRLLADERKPEHRLDKGLLLADSVISQCVGEVKVIAFAE